MSSESHSSIPQEGERKESPSTILENIRTAYRKAPFSIRGALSIIALVGSLSKGGFAEANEEVDFSYAKESYEQIVHEFRSQTKDANWRGFLEHGQDQEKEFYHEEFPDFPSSGSGVLKMDSASITAVENGAVFDGITLVYAINNIDTKGLHLRESLLKSL